MSNYNTLAPIYDFLKTLIFRNIVLRSQIVYLDRIQPDHNVLVLGGGTGEILEHITASKIDYVEPSSGMTKRAQKRKSRSEVIFHCQRFEEFDTNEKYDAVICHYFLDIFTDEELPRTISKIQSNLKVKGVLVVADFQPTDIWYHQWLERVMHFFFRSMTGLKRMRLADIPGELKVARFQLIKKKEFFKGFVFSAVFQMDA